MAPRDGFGSSISKLKARLREHPCGAFVLWGEEELLKDFYVDKWRRMIEKEGAVEFNLARMDLSRDHTLADVLAECEILPFMGEKRMVLVRGYSLARPSENDTKRLLALLENLPSYLILVFYQTEEEFVGDKKCLANKNVQKLAEKMDFVAFPLQEEKVLLPWSAKVLDSLNAKATRGALVTLFRLCRSRMILIRSELEKLSAWAIAQKKELITEEDVFLLTGDSSTSIVWQLQESVLDGNCAVTERILHNLKRQRVDPLSIAGTISRMLTAALLCLEGADAISCKKTADVAPWQYDRYRRAVRGKKKESLEKALALCLDLDRRLKGNRSDKYLVTEMAVMQITLLCRGEL